MSINSILFNLASELNELENENVLHSAQELSCNNYRQICGAICL